ncbi:MAG TPA: cyanophycin synthetase [Polyangiaceae bacterium]
MTPLEKLYERAPLGMRLGLEPMKRACAAEGEPQEAFASVHVAGTNGKGSVSAMVERIAREAGLRTGLYTSPHLCRFAERIRVDGEPIDDRALGEHLVCALDHELSFFETATLAGFLALRAARVDLAIIEVGLGGRLDATNVIRAPRAAAITRIALDHTQLLGDTLEAIAREKAAIAKPGLDLVLGPCSPSVRDAIETTARAAGATVSMAEDDREAAESLQNATIGLAGAHQRDNARIAWILGRRIGASPDACTRGIAKVEWPGRLETIRGGETTALLDAAHNPDGAHALAAFLSSRDPRQTALVFGTLADKAWPEMIDALAPRAAHRFYVAPKGRTATDPREIAARHAGTVVASTTEAFELAKRQAPCVVACGSISIVGEVRAMLLDLPRDPPIAL